MTQRTRFILYHGVRWGFIMGIGSAIIVHAKVYSTDSGFPGMLSPWFLLIIAVHVLFMSVGGMVFALVMWRTFHE